MSYSGSATVASYRVGACMSKYRAPVTAGAKVREGDEVRHHDTIAMAMVEARARKEKQTLLSADNIVGGGW